MHTIIRLSMFLCVDMNTSLDMYSRLGLCLKIIFILVLETMFVFLSCRCFYFLNNWAAHLQYLWVVIHLPLEAAFPCRGSALGEVAALVEKEKSFSIFFLQALQFSTVLPVDCSLRGQNKVSPWPVDMEISAIITLLKRYVFKKKKPF